MLRQTLEIHPEFIGLEKMCSIRFSPKSFECSCHLVDWPDTVYKRVTHSGGVRHVVYDVPRKYTGITAEHERIDDIPGRIDRAVVNDTLARRIRSISVASYRCRYYEPRNFTPSCNSPIFGSAIRVR